MVTEDFAIVMINYTKGKHISMISFWTRNKPLYFCVHSNFISISLMLQWVAFTNSNIVQSFMSSDRNKPAYL